MVAVVTRVFNRMRLAWMEVLMRQNQQVAKHVASSRGLLMECEDKREVQLPCSFHSSGECYDSRRAATTDWKALRSLYNVSMFMNVDRKSLSRYITQHPRYKLLRTLNQIVILHTL
jgi:hypothetical protein